MKSNVCKILKGTSDLEAILKESEKVAEYNELTHKQGLQLRLLCEEIDGMLPYMIGDFEGDLWMEFVDGVCKIFVSIETPELDASKRDVLINVAKNKKNAAAVGIVGKIRDAIEGFFLDEETLLALDASSESFYVSTGYYEGVDYSDLGSLQQYRNNLKKKAGDEGWDELEKSVIASVADDVIVGVKGKRADIVVVKKFA